MPETQAEGPFIFVFRTCMRSLGQTSRRVKGTSRITGIQTPFDRRNRFEPTVGVRARVTLILRQLDDRIGIFARVIKDSVGAQLQAAKRLWG